MWEWVNINDPAHLAGVHLNEIRQIATHYRLTFQPVCAFGSSTKHDADRKQRGLDADNDATFAAGLVGRNRFEAFAPKNGL